MAYLTLLYEKRNAIGYIQINRPEKLNAMTRKVLEELLDCFQALQKDEGVRVVILTGSGEKAFVAGADINELAVQDPVDGKETAQFGQQVLNFIENLGKPVIAAINGIALGGGCELAMACTLRVAAETARLGQPEVKLGLIPGYAGSHRLPRLVGKCRALELILTGETITAAPDSGDGFNGGRPRFGGGARGNFGGVGGTAFDVTVPAHSFRVFQAE